MPKSLLIAAIAVVAYLVGVETERARREDREDLRQFVEQAVARPEAHTSSKRLAKSASATLKSTRRELHRRT